MLTLFLAILAYAFIGALSGILAGLLGIGGGIVTVPCLYFVFKLLGYPQTYLMHMAIGTSLAAMVFSTFSATWQHNKKRMVLWDIFKKMAPGLLIGSFLGSLIANHLSGVILQIVFGIFLCLLGMFFFRRVTPHLEPHKLPKFPFLSFISITIGGVSNILGLGGGTLSVPVLNAFKVPPKQTIGTSAAISFLITFIGATCYLVIGLKEFSGPDTLGFVNITAFVIVGAAAFFMASYGAKLSHKISDHLLKRIFGAILILTGISMMI